MGHSEIGLSVYKKLTDYLDSHNLKYSTHDEDLLVTLTIHGNDLPMFVIIRVVDERSLIIINSPVPFKFPEDKRIDGALAVAAANYAMLNGCFDYDMSDGEIKFRLAQNYEGMEVSDDLLSYMLGVTIVSTDKYNDKFFMLGKGMITLEQFIEDKT